MKELAHRAGARAAFRKILRTGWASGGQAGGAITLAVPHQQAQPCGHAPACSFSDPPGDVAVPSRAYETARQLAFHAWRYGPTVQPGADLARYDLPDGHIFGAGRLEGLVEAVWVERYHHETRPGANGHLALGPGTLGRHGAVLCPAAGPRRSVRLDDGIVDDGEQLAGPAVDPVEVDPSAVAERPEARQALHVVGPTAVFMFTRCPAGAVDHQGVDERLVDEVTQGRWGHAGVSLGYSPYLRRHLGASACSGPLR